MCVSLVCAYVCLCVSVSVCGAVCTIGSDYCRYSQSITGWNRKNGMVTRDTGAYTGDMGGLSKTIKGVLRQGNKRNKAQMEDQSPAVSMEDFMCRLIF